MPRQLRIEYPGAIYHVLSRGDRRENIFNDDTDREAFLRALGEVCQKAEWQVHAYCLMPNHFHLVVETPRGNLVAGMKWFLGVYTKRFNIRHKQCGHLFAGRYKSLLVDGSGTNYFRTVCDYVHLNPSRAALIGRRARLESFRWSSYPQYLAASRLRPAWLRVDRVFGEKGIYRDDARGRREFSREIEARRAAENGEDYWAIRRGWCFGRDVFRTEMAAKAEKQVGGGHYGQTRRETEEQKAGRIVAEELVRLGWKESDLATYRKGDPGKIEIARRLRTETTLGLKWIARRLEMGSWTYVSNLLGALRK